MRVNNMRTSPEVWSRCRAANLKSDSYRDLQTCLRSGAIGAPPALESITTTIVIDPDEEARKARVRATSGYRDPPGTRVIQ